MSEEQSRRFVLECRVCRRPVGTGAYFCASCGVLRSDRSAALYGAAPRLRLGAFAVDYLIIWLTAGIGWLVWLLFVAPRGQSPGKSLVGISIVRVDGAVPPAPFVWLREFGWDLAVGAAAVVLLALLGAVAASLEEFLYLWLWLSVLFWAVSLLDAAWLLWDQDRQTLHDKVLRTLVVERRSK